MIIFTPNLYTHIYTCIYVMHFDAQEEVKLEKVCFSEDMLASQMHLQ